MPQWWSEASLPQALDQTHLCSRASQIASSVTDRQTHTRHVGRKLHAFAWADNRDWRHMHRQVGSCHLVNAVAHGQLVILSWWGTFCPTNAAPKWSGHGWSSTLPSTCHRKGDQSPPWGPPSLPGSPPLLAGTQLDCQSAEGRLHKAGKLCLQQPTPR